eukprot:6033953-Prymnesium_polylepis.1
MQPVREAQVADVLQDGRIELDKGMVILDGHAERVVGHRCLVEQLFEDRRHATQREAPVHPSAVAFILEHRIADGAAAILVQVALNENDTALGRHGDSSAALPAARAPPPEVPKLATLCCQPAEVGCCFYSAAVARPELQALVLPPVRRARRDSGKPRRPDRLRARMQRACARWACSTFATRRASYSRPCSASARPIGLEEIEKRKRS